jgi:hypothetical protein
MNRARYFGIIAPAGADEAVEVDRSTESRIRRSQIAAV